MMMTTSSPDRSFDHAATFERTVRQCGHEYDAALARGLELLMHARDAKRPCAQLGHELAHVAEALVAIGRRTDAAVGAYLRK